MSTERDIKEAIRAIGGNENGKTFFTAEVVSVSSDTCTIKSDELEMSDVAVCAIGGANGNSLIVVPKIGSTVLVADLSEGTRRDLVIVKYTEVETVTINGGNLGGLVNIEQLTNKLNQLVNTFNSHIHPAALGTSPVTVLLTESQAVSFSKSDYEDQKIKH